MAFDAETASIDSASLHALRCVEREAAMDKEEHYWVFGLTFASAPPGDDLVLADAQSLRGLSAVYCDTCLTTQNTGPCPGPGEG